MEFDQEKLNVYCAEIVYVYEYGYENDCVITQAKSPRPSNRDASTEPRGPSAKPPLLKCLRITTASAIITLTNYIMEMFELRI